MDAGAGMAGRAPEVSALEAADAQGRAALGDGAPNSATVAVSSTTDEAAQNMNGMRVLGKAPRSRIAGDCAMERDDGDDGRAPARALHRVTDASGEEGSGWSLETLGHVRRDTAGAQRSIEVGLLDRSEGNRLRRNRGPNAARRASAALVQGGLGGVGLSPVCMVGAGLMTTRISHVSLILRCRLGVTVIIRDSVMVLPCHMRVGVIVLPQTTRNHRRRGHALQWQGDRHQAQQDETNKSRHG